MYEEGIPGFTISALILLRALNSNMHNFVFGHTFSVDESASFLSKVEIIKLESQLAQQQLSENETHLTKT
jgi:hypothetical protein